MGEQEHWEKVYATKAPTEVSWFRPHLETSIALIERAAGRRSHRSSTWVAEPPAWSMI
jgi:hypothetical protein